MTWTGLERGDDDRSRREELQQDRHAHVLGRAAFLGVDGLEDARVCGEAARNRKGPAAEECAVPLVVGLGRERCCRRSW